MVACLNGEEVSCLADRWRHKVLDWLAANEIITGYKKGIITND